MHRLPSRPALACHVTQSDLELQNLSMQVGPRTLNSLACLRCLCLPSETAKASCNELQIHGGPQKLAKGKTQNFAKMLAVQICSRL